MAGKKPVSATHSQRYEIQHRTLPDGTLEIDFPVSELPPSFYNFCEEIALTESQRLELADIVQEMGCANYLKSVRIRR